MQDDRTLQFEWLSDVGRPAMFTHTMDRYSYCTPWFTPGVYFNNPWIMPPVNASNVGEIADSLAENMRERAAFFEGDSLLYPWGCDFQFHGARVMFENMEKVLAHMHSLPDVYGDLDIRFTGLDDYFADVQANATAWPVRGAADFFPYSSRNESVWTGFYSTRPSLKELGRRAEAALRAARCLSVQAALVSRRGEARFPEEEVASKLVAVFQHHDAITGTHQPHVSQRYADQLDEALDASYALIADSTAALLRRPGAPEGSEWDFKVVRDTQSSLANDSDSVPFVFVNSLHAWRSPLMELFVDYGAFYLLILYLFSITPLTTWRRLCSSGCTRRDS